jgi:hypothetical protein
VDDLRDLAAAYDPYSEYFASVVGRWCGHVAVDVRGEIVG